MFVTFRPLMYAVELMVRPFRFGLVVLSLFILGESVNAQIDEICAELGVMPSMDRPSANVPYVFGKILLKGFPQGQAGPKVAVIFSDSQQPSNRLIVDKSGNYCFRRTGGPGTLVVEVNGLEVARRTLASFGAAQQREDFEIYPAPAATATPPGVLSAKFSHPVNPNTSELYKKVVEAEKAGDPEKAIGHLKEIVAIDAADFIAWAKLASLYFERKAYPEAETALKKSLELKVEYTPAWIIAGKIRVAQRQFESAIEIFKQAISTDKTSARAYQLLGEAYLLNKQGTLGVEALNQAIKLDPVGMAESHLMIARLYDLAGAKNLASREYRIFLTKVPDHPDKIKLEKYVKDNPE